jgi:hypothetical protein
VLAHTAGNLTGELLPDGTSLMTLELVVLSAAALAVASRIRG